MKYPYEGNHIYSLKLEKEQPGEIKIQCSLKVYSWVFEYLKQERFRDYDKSEKIPIL